MDKPARPIALIETFLRQQNKEQLISDLLDLIDGDRQLRHEWLIRAENGLGGMDKATVRKRITAAIPLNQFFIPTARYGLILPMLNTLWRCWLNPSIICHRQTR